jgi:phosphoglycerol transferase MdoB-like AlkP superfamily enzyme
MADTVSLFMSWKPQFRAYRRLAQFSLAFLAFLSLSRLLLVVVFWERVAPTQGLAVILGQGIRFDLILLASLVGPVFLLWPWFRAARFLRAAGNWLWPLYLGMMSAAVFFVEASTVSFIRQFDARPNYLFVEYLEYPREVLSTLVGTNPLELLLFSVIALLLVVGVTRWLRRDPERDRRLTPGFCLLMTPLVAVIMFAMIRSTLAHRPVNPSNAAFSQDAMVNQLPLNSPYSILHAIYERRKEEANERISYGYLPDEEVLNIVRREAGLDSAEPLDPNKPTLHRQAATLKTDRPLNLVIILQESLGAEFVGELGGKDLTPNLDGLADEGIWFERLYATGIRSARGIEAVITGFTPSPRTNVVKRSDTQDGFFTLAGLLADHGYRTRFIYGGESHFDNMRRFFLNNGFENVIDVNDFDAGTAVYKGSWGMSDEDMYGRAHEELGDLAGEPFFALLFTTSHHEPFDIPAGRVSESEYGPRETSIKYADYALGRFLERARQSSYWENTLFLVVADHNAKIFGGRLVPVERFRIPGVIIGDSVEPRRIEGIASQIDLVPTLLSLIGLESEHPAIGRDLTRPEWLGGSGRAMMQFHANQAFIEGDRVVVFQPDLAPESFRLTAEGKMESDPAPDPVLERKALAHALWGPLMIRRQAYRR